MGNEEPYGTMTDRDSGPRWLAYSEPNELTPDETACRLLGEIRDELRTTNELLTRFAGIAESFGQFAAGPMAKSPLLKMLGLGG